MSSARYVYETKQSSSTKWMGFFIYMKPNPQRTHLNSIGTTYPGGGDNILHRLSMMLTFMKGEVTIALIKGAVVFSVVAYANHVEARGGQYNLTPVALIAGGTAFALSTLDGWRNRERSARVDASHSNTYYQEIRVRNALATINAVVEMCQHNYDSDHQKCRSAVMAQLQVIKSVYGGGPDPHFIVGGKAVPNSNTERKRVES